MQTDRMQKAETSAWFSLLQDRERDLVGRFLICADTALVQRTAEFVNMMNLLEELVGPPRSRIGFMSLWEDAWKAGILKHTEKDRLVNFCISYLYF